MVSVLLLSTHTMPLTALQRTTLRMPSFINNADARETNVSHNQIGKGQYLSNSTQPQTLMHLMKQACVSEVCAMLQATDLKDMFEEVNGMKDCLQRCVTGMGGAFKKSQISRQLKAMGLKRNRLTDSQVLPCSAVLCPAAPNCAVPCSAVPCCAVPCCAVPCCAVPCCAVLCCAVHQPINLSAYECCWHNPWWLLDCTLLGGQKVTDTNDAAPAVSCALPATCVTSLYSHSVCSLELLCSYLWHRLQACTLSPLCS